MKKNLLLLIFLIFISFSKAVAQGCLADGIRFITQEQIDSFPINFPGCIQIMGDVKIKKGLNETITNLKGLSQITFIAGNLNVWNNDSLTSLKGLDNLTVVYGNFLVHGNSALLSLNGLEKLDSINGDFGIINNESLTSLNGLDNLTSLDSNLVVINNNSLTSLRGVENLTSVGGWLSVKENTYLTSLDGLDNLTSISGYLEIENNASLGNLNSLKNLTSIGGYLKVQHNASLTSLSGLDSVVYLGGDMDVYNNPSLMSLDELENLNPAGEKIKKNRKSANYKIWVTSMDNSKKYRGYLREVEDSTIVVSNYLNKKKSNYLTLNIDIRGVEKIKFRKKGKVGKSILWGAFTGAALGAIIGLASGDDVPGRDCPLPRSGPTIPFDGLFERPCYSAGEKAVIGGVGGGAWGILIGGIVGSVKIKIPINGNQKTFKNRKGDLFEYKISN
jgi:hypothetical protein